MSLNPKIALVTFDPTSRNYRLKACFPEAHIIADMSEELDHYDHIIMHGKAESKDVEKVRRYFKGDLIYLRPKNISLISGFDLIMNDEVLIRDWIELNYIVPSLANIIRLGFLYTKLAFRNLLFSVFRKKQQDSDESRQAS